MQDDPTIILAEDDDGHAQLLRNGLRKAGFHNRVVRLCDGEEALEYLHGPDGPLGHPAAAAVLMLDIRMPRLDGIEVLRTVRGNRAFDALPVIMVTTADDPGEKERCLRLGCNHYLMKPVDWKLLSMASGGVAGLLTPPISPPVN